MSMKIVIVGRTHCGKNLLAELLSTRFGLKLLKTSTDRPRRWPEEDTYHFYTKEESAGIPMSEKLLYTESVDGHARWADKDRFMEADIAILDPPGATEAVKLWQAAGHAVKAVYVLAEGQERRAKWIQDIVENGGGDEGLAAIRFEERESIESAMFGPIEEMIEAGPFPVDAKPCPFPNIWRQDGLRLFGADIAQTWRNTFDMSGMQGFAGRIGREILAHSAIPGQYRKFQLKEPIILEPEDWTEAEWAALMKMLGLNANATERAVLKLDCIECFLNPENRNTYRS